MFKRTKPPKHILFIGEKSEARDYIIEVIKESVMDPKEKIPTHTFSSEEPEYESGIREALLKKTDGTVFLINSTKTKELSRIKEYLWEYFVWNEATKNIPVLIASYNAEKAIALTSSEIIEAYSLIRLTDRLWNVMEIHENKPEDILSCFSWLDDYIEVLGIKPKVLKKKESSKSSVDKSKRVKK
ncbi:MAG: ADP-ribosylation factor-like protein [Candidatus Heimdallarchaeota archaeon]